MNFMVCELYFDENVKKEGKTKTSSGIQTQEELITNCTMF
jgi:hypothetical protein